MILSPLYHWSPADRYDAISKEGLRPGSPANVATEPLSYLCFGTSPTNAWRVSGAMEWVSEVDEWDLWQAIIVATDLLYVRSDWGPDIVEVKIRNPIPVDRLWWVGRRDKDGVPR